MIGEAKKNPPGWVGGFEVCLCGVSSYPPHREGIPRK
jgi:hypothetical protein